MVLRSGYGLFRILILQLYWVCTSLIRSKSCSSNSVELLASFCGRKEDMIEKV